MSDMVESRSFNMLAVCGSLAVMAAFVFSPAAAMTAGDAVDVFVSPSGDDFQPQARLPCVPRRGPDRLGP